MKLALVAAVAAMAFATDVSADEAAVVAQGDGCVFLSADGGAQFTDSAAKFTAVQKPGWVLFTCQGQLPGGVTPPPAGVTINGTGTAKPCGTSLGVTLFWREVITPTGGVVLVCKYAREPNG